MHKFLFVYPKVVPGDSYYAFPLGLAYVSASMRAKGFNVFTLNLNHHPDPEGTLKETIRTNGITVVATGGVSIFWNQIENLLKTVKDIDDSIITIAGGAIMTSTPELAIKNLATDFGVIGEGEITMPELAYALNNKRDAKDIRGIIYRTADGNIIKTQNRDPITNLDELPLPDYDGFDFAGWLGLKWIFLPSLKGLFYDCGEKKRLVEIIASRSCPFQCTFCYHPLGKLYRQRSVDNVISEIEMLKNKYGITLISFLDELFSCDARRVNSFAEFLAGTDLKWMAQWRVDAVTSEAMINLKKSGIFILGLGVESMSDKILESMKKRITSRDVQKALDTASAQGVRTGSNIILGDPAETEITAKESLDWIRDHPQYDFNIDFILAIPDAEIYRGAVRSGIIKDELKHIKAGFPVLNLTGMSDRSFRRLRRKVMFWNETFRYKPWGKIISSTPTNDFDSGKKIYAFSVECPSCGKTSSYRHYMITIKPFTPILCKNCFKILRVRTGEAFYAEYSTIKSYVYFYASMLYNMYLIEIPFIKKFYTALLGLNAF